MAKTKTAKPASHAGEPPAVLPVVHQPESSSAQPVTTGRYVVIYKKGASDPKTVKASLQKTAGLRNVPVAGDFAAGAISAAVLEESPAVHLESLGIAVVSGEEQMAALAASVSDADSPILAIEPEYIAYLSPAEMSQDYLRGYRDAVNNLYDSLWGASVQAVSELRSVYQDSAQYTWGLQATNVPSSRYSGQGIRVAVLDTGFDATHPDFAGRLVSMESFSGETPDDVHGHGTHCIGTACGPKAPATGVRRYGIAYNAQIFAGKVFNNAPRPQAPTLNVLAGIEWALTQGCQVASLSLGVPVNQKIMQYEETVKRALDAGLLIVAAAGNNAQRPQNPGFVEPPANADAILAVAALDNNLAIAPFSAQSSQLTGVGGKVNVAAPGVRIFSSLPVALGQHTFLDGTSMATPHAAGVAALLAEATGERGAQLWNRLLQTALSLPLPGLDVGSGLVQAPQ